MLAAQRDQPRRATVRASHHREWVFLFGQPAFVRSPQALECDMSKDKGGRAAKKPKAEKNIKTTGQTPAQGSGAISASTAKVKK